MKPEDCFSYLCTTLFFCPPTVQADAQLSLRLMFRLQVLPLTKQLTNVSGNLWARSLKGARAERIEFLLLHEFHRLKYIVPDKAAYGENYKQQASAAAAADDGDLPEALGMDDDDEEAGGRGGGGNGGRVGTGNIARNSKKRAKPAYSGGLVLEPKKGLYDKFVLLLDFNSLYPSIIQVGVAGRRTWLCSIVSVLVSAHDQCRSITSASQLWSGSSVASQML
jgi:DNA polymerase alpha subunit A